MKVQREEKDGVVVLRLEGKLMGGPDADVIHAAVKEAISQGKRNVLIDLADVSWVNSTGLGILITNYTTLKQNEGMLKLVNVSKRIESILMVTKLNTVFESFSSETDALASFSS